MGKVWMGLIGLYGNREILRRKPKRPLKRPVLRLVVGMGDAM
jgi:hypothetical protein